MIFRPSDAEFKVEELGIKKCVHRKCPKDLDSNGKTELPCRGYVSWDHCTAALSNKDTVRSAVSTIS